jgi:hypothetical protein
MPFLAMLDTPGIWQLLALALVVAGAAGGSVYLARKHHTDAAGLPDAVFWDGFAGLAVVTPAVLLPALASPATGLALTGVALTTAAASFRWTPAILRRQQRQRDAREAAVIDADAAVRHGAVLARWQRYELDPALCIDFPAMSDPRHPATAAMLKAMRAADILRSENSGNAGGTAPGPGRQGSGYSDAVARLEDALAEAERAAGAFQLSTGRVQ